MSAHEMLHPDQFGKLRFADFPGGSIDEVADRLYRNEPQFMAKLERSVRRSGVREPVEVDQQGRLQEGHHRIAAAYRAGQPVPTAPYEPVRPSKRDTRTRVNSDRWRMIRYDIPEEYDARMEHDRRIWRKQ